MREIGDLAERWDEFRAQFDGEVVGVCWTDDVAEARRVEAEAKAPFRSALDRGGVAKGGCARAYQVRSFPSAVLVGADGRIERRRVHLDLPETFAPPR